MFSDRL